MANDKKKKQQPTPKVRVKKETILVECCNDITKECKEVSGKTVLGSITKFGKTYLIVKNI